MNVSRSTLDTPPPPPPRTRSLPRRLRLRSRAAPSLRSFLRADASAANRAPSRAQRRDRDGEACEQRRNCAASTNFVARLAPGSSSSHAVLSHRSQSVDRGHRDCSFTQIMADLDSSVACTKAYSDIEEDFFRAGDELASASGSDSAFEIEPEPERRSLWSRLLSLLARRPAVTDFIPAPARSRSPTYRTIAREDDDEWDWVVAVARARARTQPVI